MSSLEEAPERPATGRAHLVRWWDQTAVADQPDADHDDEREDASEREDISRVEGNEAAIPADDQWVWNLHAVPGGGEAVPEKTCSQKARSRRDESRWDPGNRDHPGKEREGQCKPAKGSLVVGPCCGGHAHFHEQVHGSKRHRHAEHDPDPSHAADGIGAEDAAAGQDRHMELHLDGGFVLDDDRSRIVGEDVHAFLSTSYWAAGRTRELSDELIATAARVVGLYAPDGRQVGFTRVVSDGRTVSYLADVYVLEEYRGLGLGLELVRFTVDEGGLARTKWLLHTRDMHRLYVKVGFAAPEGRAMERGPTR